MNNTATVNLAASNGNLPESGTQKYLLSTMPKGSAGAIVGDIDTVEEAHINAFNNYNGSLSKTSYTGIQDGSEGGYSVDIQLTKANGNGVTDGPRTIVGRGLNLYSIYNYQLIINLDETMYSAVKNDRVEFYIDNIIINGINIQIAKRQHGLGDGSVIPSSPNRHFGNKITRSYSVEGQNNLSHTLEMPESLNDKNNTFPLLYNSPYTSWNTANDFSTAKTSNFVPNSSQIKINLQLKLEEHFQTWWTMGTYMWYETNPTVTIGWTYKTSNITVKTMNSAYGKVISPNDPTGSYASLTYPVDINGRIGDTLLTATAVPNDGYCFIYWRKANGDNEDKDIYDPQINTVRLYNHNLNDVGDGIVYEAIFDEIKVTDQVNNQYSNYTYNGVGQGPRVYVDFLFTNVNHSVAHTYKARSGTTFANSTISINSTQNIIDNTDTNKFLAGKPIKSGDYSYSVQITRSVTRNAKNENVVVGKLDSAKVINFAINNYTPQGSILENNITLDNYYYGQTISSNTLLSSKNDNDQPILKDTYIRGSNNQILGTLIGTYKFKDDSLNNGQKRLESPSYGEQVVFVPTDPNINQITLSGSINISIIKTTLKLGYLNGSTLTEGLENLSLNAINYGQLREDLGISDKVVLYNPYTYNDSNAMASVYFGYVPYDISSWGVIEVRPAATDSLTEATLTFTLNQNISGTATPFSTYYELPTEIIKVKYLVNKAKLVFSGEENQQLNFTYTYYTNSTSSTTTVSSNIILMYGQGLKAISIAAKSSIQSNVTNYIDHGTIRFTWYRQISGTTIDNNNLLDDYYEQKFLTVAESTNAYNTQNPNYYCLKAEWLIPDGSAVNSNYEPYYFYNQSINISRAELNASIKFEQSTEINSDAPVIKPITYGESVDKALSTNINKGKTLNVANQDLEVYYKIEWIIDELANTIASLNNYPYALVENSGQYAVQISIYKDDGYGNLVQDTDNYQQNGVFFRNDSGNAFAFASLVVNRASQNFYLMVDGSLVELNNNNLTTVMTNLNEYVYKESTEGLSINYDAVGGKTDTNIELETVYI
ncbi:MAG: hypothetical protein LBF68_07570, partial [Christensenellaceae bacterium]|nr:hypothetical protein [Christensenellaceae bacterium]